MPSRRKPQRLIQPDARTIKPPLTGRWSIEQGKVIVAHVELIIGDLLTHSRIPAMVVQGNTTGNHREETQT